MNFRQTLNITSIISKFQIFPLILGAAFNIRQNPVYTPPVYKRMQFLILLLPRL